MSVKIQIQIFLTPNHVEDIHDQCDDDALHAEVTVFPLLFHTNIHHSGWITSTL